jgi:hypothetical protein
VRAIFPQAKETVHGLSEGEAVIPAFGLSGALPPFVGSSATVLSGVSPYSTTMSEIVTTLATSPERAKLCKGLLDYRKALRDLGVVKGIQWIDGSFCENVEMTRGRPPGDIDIVTLLERPPAHQADLAWIALVNSNLLLFQSAKAKSLYGCEAFFIDLNRPVDRIVSQITYWFGLFTHQKVTHLWKGILQVPLISDDAAAELQVNNILTPPLLPPPLPPAP